MKLGIKVGLRGNSPKDLQATCPDFCEVWFHSGKIDDYDNLFREIKKSGCGVGLHFWGATSDGTLANFAYPDREILRQSRELLRQTIEIAARHNALYVNMHPCGKLLSKVDFEKAEFVPFTKQAEFSQVFTNLQESLFLAAEQAKNSGITLTLESVPSRSLGAPWTGKDGRIKPIYIGELTVAETVPLIDGDKIYFANDFGHSAGNIISDNRDLVIKTVFEITRRLAVKTRLLHVGYIIPPYNGTDYHGNLYSDEFKSPPAVPNILEMKQLLNLFNRREDVYALVEPEKDHIGNFRILKQLVQEIL